MVILFLFTDMLNFNAITLKCFLIVKPGYQYLTGYFNVDQKFLFTSYDKLRFEHGPKAK
ncbi:hypothetical protein MgSA37_01860 [Mucilaginibacter gotjawali]|uniref:Uncharacterized protein n=1 Tax=Mucilaginibacter gotjawali TaxID=1550579 RepID=A0A0X8X0R6_9SPHI|nr:hypothetical protein MgSA37_01860 [Mucilaginibacter gotjawali]